MPSIVIHAKRYALALLLAVMIIVPVVDASVCFSEEQSHQEVAGPGDGHPDKAHVASNGFTSAEAARNEGGHTFYEQPMTSHIPDTLIRPPRL